MTEITPEEAVKAAKRVLVLVGLVGAVALVVLVIDQGIKRVIIEEAQKAQAILGEIQGMKEARNGAAPAQAAGDLHGAGLDGCGCLPDAPTAGADVAEAGSVPKSAANGRKARLDDGA